MPKTPMQTTRDQLAKIYGIGILVFTGIFGSITLFARFLAYLNMT